MRALDTEVPSAVGVAIQVGDGVRSQLVGMCFDPFGRAEQTRLFSVPGGIDDGSLWTPALFVHRAESAGFLQFSDESRDGILSAIHPGVMMISTDHPLVRLCSSRQPAYHVVKSFEAPVRSDLEMDSCRSSAESVGDWEATAPCGWGEWSAQRSEERLGVTIGNRQDRYFGDRRGLGDGQSLRGLGSTDARRERITGIGGHVGDGTALNSLSRAHWAGRKDIAAGVTIIAWI